MISRPTAAVLAILTIGGTAAASPAAAATPASAAPIQLNTKNWSASAGFGSRRAAWYTDGSGVVHLQGAVRQTNHVTPTAPLIGTLPPAARPNLDVYAIVHTFSGTYADVEITRQGSIFAIDPEPPAVTDLRFLSLEGISYRPKGSGSLIALNTANWSEAIAQTRFAAWYKDRSGIVHLQGTAEQISSAGSRAGVLGTLPPAARPARTVYSVVSTNTVDYADVAILPDGTIALIAPRPPAITSFNLVSLESITFRPSGSTHPLGVNTANFSASAGFNSRRPAWYTDRSGIVHLQGAVKQVKSSGAGARLIAILPRAARPSHTVFVLVHTFLGTYADLAILPNGKIGLIDPRPPLVTDYTFVSLEGISYRR